MRDSLSKNLSYSSKVNEFAALKTRESVSRYSGHKHNDVCPTMCGKDLKHAGTHEYVGHSPVEAVD